MGKLYCIEIELTKPMTDERLYALLKKCEGNYGKMQDVTFHFPEMTSSPLADRLVDFIFNYQEGFLAPNRWDYYEPVRKLVDENTREQLKSVLSKHGTVLLKKSKAPGVTIMVNNDECPSLTPSVTLAYRESRTTISLFPDLRRKFVIEDWSTLLQDFCREMETDYGYIWDLSTHELFANVFSIPFHERINRNQNEILGTRRMYEAVHAFEDSVYPTLGWHSSRFYPLISDYRNKDYIQMGLYALDLLKDTLSADRIDDVHFGLRLDLSRLIVDTKGIQWEDPANYQDSLVFLSRRDLIDSFRYFETDEITQLSPDQSSLFTRFSRVYFKQSTKDSRYRELLLIP